MRKPPPIVPPARELETLASPRRPVPEEKKPNRGPALDAILREASVRRAHALVLLCAQVTETTESLRDEVTTALMLAHELLFFAREEADHG